MSAALAWAARDLAAYSLQLAAVVAAGLALAALLRMRVPAVKLAFTQALLVLALALPLLQPRPEAAAPAVGARVWLAGTDGGAAGARDPWAVAGLVIAVGVAVHLAWLLRRLATLRRVRRRSRPLETDAVIAEAYRRVGVRAEVRASADIGVPAAFGAGRPVVLVPPRFERLDAPARLAVLCHELVHVRRRDWLQVLGEEVAAALLWFHPAVWGLRSQIRLAREQVVDREAVRLTGERRAYLEALVGMARLAAPAPRPAALFLTESHLERRVDVLLKEVTMSKVKVAVVLAAAVAGVAGAGTSAVRAFPLQAGGTPAAAGAAAEGEEKKGLARKRTVKVDPTYPAEAKKVGIEGDVVVEVLITKAGEVKEPKATKGPRELFDSATRAVEQWKFEPAAHDTRATFTIRYALEK